MIWIALGLAGLAVGCFGTLIGAGGGFLLVPLLVFLYPKEEPETITSISLAVVFVNAASGSFGYWRQRKVDVRSGLRFCAAAIPGSVAGVFLNRMIPRATFEVILGAVLVIVAFFIFLRPPRATREEPEAASGIWGPTISHHRGLGLFIAFWVGLLSSLLGIGGGIMHVPALAHLLGFPVHVATATSHFVLATTAGAGTLTHVLTGSFQHGVRRALSLGIGAVIGAQIGARLARRARPEIILRSLAAALAIVGVRIAAAGLGVWA